MTQLVSAIRKVAREVPGAAEQIAAVCTGHDYSRPGKPKIDWDDPAAKDALVSALVNDANVLVAALAGRDLEESAASAVALLALVTGQDVGPAEGSDGTDGRWRIARKVAEDRVISVNDPDARHTRKSPEARRDGYRAHVAADPDTGIITDEKLTKAAGQENSDPAVAGEFLDAEAATGDTAPVGTADDRNLSWYGDSEPRLAQAPDRGAEPPEPGREGAGTPGRRLGAGHLSRRPAQLAPAGPSDQVARGSRARQPIRGKPGQAARQTADPIPAAAESGRASKQTHRKGPIQQAPSCRSISGNKTGRRSHRIMAGYPVHRRADASTAMLMACDGHTSTRLWAPEG